MVLLSVGVVWLFVCTVGWVSVWWLVVCSWSILQGNTKSLLQSLCEEDLFVPGKTKC